MDVDIDHSSRAALTHLFIKLLLIIVFFPLLLVNLLLTLRREVRDALAQVDQLKPGSNSKAKTRIHTRTRRTIVDGAYTGMAAAHWSNLRQNLAAEYLTWEIFTEKPERYTYKTAHVLHSD